MDLETRFPYGSEHPKGKIEGGGEQKASTVRLKFAREDDGK